MFNTLNGLLDACWGILNEAAPYVLFGFFAAGLLRALLPEQAIVKHLGGAGFRPVLKASLFGIPLPLCSCGVIPVAIGLRKQGASKGATASFLVSVPETGVDSIAITWALLDPLMTVIRPLSAFFTALLTGSLINLLPDRTPAPAGASRPGCGCATTPVPAAAAPARQALGSRLKHGVIYAFTDLLKDIGSWLMLGIVLAGIISYVVPVDFVERFLGGELRSLLIMLVVGIPLYICASASTPVAAALVLKGLSPGAALVFLLAGPATNAATMTVVTRQLGKAAGAVYVLAIAVSALVLGWLTNRIYSGFSVDITDWVGQVGQATNSPLSVISSWVLLALLLRNYLPWKKSQTDECTCTASGEE